MRKPNTGTVAALLAGVVILHLPGRFALADHAVHGRRLTVVRRNAFGDCEMPAKYGSCKVSSHWASSPKAERDMGSGTNEETKVFDRRRA